MVNFYIKGMSTTNEEQERIINSFKEKGIDVEVKAIAKLMKFEKMERL